MSGFSAPVRPEAPVRPSGWDDALEAALGPDRAARWLVNRGQYRPTIRVARVDGAPVAAVLTSGRPATAAVKIVDLWWDGSEAGLAEAGALLDTVVAASRLHRDAAVKWELAPGEELPALAVERGFVPLRSPWAAKGTERFGGGVLWLVDLPHDELGYYAQTTLYTCGAVAALMAVEARGARGFAGDAADRDRELDFWRAATNHPACEPVGLAVRLREDVGADAGVEVSLDADGPVLLEGYEGFEREYRAELQEQSLSRAEALGVPVGRERVSMAELESRLTGGEVALLLVDEAPMHGVTGAHWIVAHAARDGMFVVEDPWVEDAAGETWVDTHAMPVAAEDLDRMVAWGPEGYRGIVFLRRQ